MADAVRRSLIISRSFTAMVRILLVAVLRSSCENGSTLPGVRTVVHDCLIKGLVMSSRVYLGAWAYKRTLNKF